jgi:hypothetical protein
LEVQQTRGGFSYDELLPRDAKNFDLNRTSIISHQYFFFSTFGKWKKNKRAAILIIETNYILFVIVIISIAARLFFFHFPNVEKKKY